MNKLLYIAGPYSGEINKNIAEAERVSMNLIRNGFHVLTPHKNTQNYEIYEDGNINITTNTWIQMDLDLLSRCDAIYMMKNWRNSPGAIGEYKFAMMNNITIIFEQNYPSETFSLHQYSGLNRWY